MMSKIIVLVGSSLKGGNTDTRDFPKQTSLLDVVSVLDRVLARRIELNEAVGLHKPLIEHRKMQTKALDDEEAKEKNSGIWPVLARQLFFYYTYCTV